MISNDSCKQLYFGGLLILMIAITHATVPGFSRAGTPYLGQAGMLLMSVGYFGPFFVWTGHKLAEILNRGNDRGDHDVQ